MFHLGAIKAFQFYSYCYYATIPINVICMKFYMLNVSYYFEIISFTNYIITARGDITYDFGTNLSLHFKYLYGVKISYLLPVYNYTVQI